MATENGTAFKRYLARYPVATFFLMGLSFLAVGLLSLNLIYMFSANFQYILSYGVMGLLDGGLVQLGELLLTGCLGIALYLVFKACEKVLVERLLEKVPAPTKQ